MLVENIGISITNEVTSFLYNLAPLIAITVAQAKYILQRDGRCLFPDPHYCRGKLTVHHIYDKSDEPNNLVTVCTKSHWGYLHRDKCQETQQSWADRLSDAAETNTEYARRRGIEFPY